MIVDSHQHYWDVSRGDYYWMQDNPAVEAICKNYFPEDLEPHLRLAGIDKTVVVQAAPSVEETRFLLQLAEKTDSLAKVVGWIDFENTSHAGILDEFSTHSKFAGVRPMIQDIPDVNWMLRSDVQWAFDALIERDLTFDALGFPRHLQAFETLFEHYPDLRVVIDHGMKPEISSRQFDLWAESMARIASTTGVYCKCSGLLTEAAAGDGQEQLAPYIRHLFSIFPKERLMWGSDWPVLTLAGSYQQWFEMVRLLIDVDASSGRSEWLFGRSAALFYNIEIA